MSAEPEPEETALPPDLLPTGKDELNLCEFPIAALSDRVPAGQKTIEFQDRIYDERKGELVTRKLTITASDKYGLPTAKDDEVILCLVQLTKEANGFSERTVRFSRSELIRLLGWPDQGQSYKRLDLSLKRWLGVSLYYENAWWDKEQQSWTSRGFHIIESFEVNDSRSLDGRMEFLLSRFTWNEVVFRSFQAGYLKSLNLNLYLGLKLATSKRMYRFLDKRFYHRPSWTFDLREFAHEHVGLSRSYADSGKIKEKLQPAIRELEEIGFLEPMRRDERYQKLGRGEWKITLAHKGKKAIAEKTRAAGPSELEKALTERGVTAATAAKLIADHPEEYIREKIEVFDWLAAKKDKRVQKSPAGYLVESIRGRYEPPKGFESKANREERLRAQEKATRRAAEAKRRAEEEEKSREEEEQARIKAYLDSLTGEERERLEAEALTDGNPFFIQQYRRNRDHPERSARYLKLLIDSHVMTILDGELRTGTTGQAESPCG